jgi:hypothetical protein
MAQEDLVQEGMGLSLQEANAGIELICNTQILVLSWEVSNESRIMCSNLCNIGILARAQCSVPVASCGTARPDQEKPEEYLEKHLVDLDRILLSTGRFEERREIRENRGRVWGRGIYGKQIHLLVPIHRPPSLLVQLPKGDQRTESFGVKIRILE